MNQLIRQLERIRSTTRALLVTREACSLLVSTVLWIMILVVLDYLFLLPSLVRLFLLLVGCTLFLHRV